MKWKRNLDLHYIKKSNYCIAISKLTITYKKSNSVYRAIIYYYNNQIWTYNYTRLSSAKRGLIRRIRHEIKLGNMFL
jgi:hypothetical protein